MTLAEITLLDSSTFDAELAMWYPRSVEEKEQIDLYVLYDVSEPLVVACERERILVLHVSFSIITYNYVSFNLLYLPL